MKKKWTLIILVLIIFLCGFCFIKNLTLYVWVNPYSEVSGLEYINNDIKELNRALKYTQKIVQKEGYKFKYKYMMPCGSGFLKNNPIPNDLDISLGIDLGTFDYDGTNAKEIAEQVAEEICLFESSLNYYINFNKEKLYIDQSYIEKLKNLIVLKKTISKNICDNLEKSLSGKSYVVYTMKESEKWDGRKHNYMIPYIMESNQLLLENYFAINLHSDNFSYSPNMRMYEREILVLPDYYVKIKNKNKITEITLLPEMFLGVRAEIMHKFYASSVFVNLYSMCFLNKTEFLTDRHVEIRFKTLLNHVNAINNICNSKLTIKIFKRIMQVADILNPLLPEGKYQEIANYVYENLSDKDIQLINEYLNITNVFEDITSTPYLFFNLQQDGKIKDYCDALENVILEIKERKIVDKDTADALLSMHANVYKQALKIKDENELIEYRELLFQKKNSYLKSKLQDAFINKIHHKEKIQEYVDLYESIYKKAGYQKIELYWLDKDVLGIKETPSTLKIKNLKQMAKENNLVDVNYKLIKSPEFLSPMMRYDVRVRYNTTKTEDENYANMIKTLEADKKNFNIKWKLIF